LGFSDDGSASSHIFFESGLGFFVIGSFQNDGFLQVNSDVVNQGNDSLDGTGISEFGSGQGQ